MLKPYHTKRTIEAGCDEAGRGCLAGPVFAAAVVLPQGYNNPLLNDSKKLSIKQRLALKEQIQIDAVSYSVQCIPPSTIDQINILNASILAMHHALDGLTVEPKQILVDGNRFKPFRAIPHLCIIKGDGLYASIAAASILAKTYRDEYMLALAKEFPSYGWESNMGYPTKKHREAIAEFGITIHHRRSFKLTDMQLKLSFRR